MGPANYRTRGQSISREQATKLRECLDRIDEFQMHRQRIESEIEQIAEFYAYPLELIRTVPGFSSNSTTAIALIAEIGAGTDPPHHSPKAVTAAQPSNF